MSIRAYAYATAICATVALGAPSLALASGPSGGTGLSGSSGSSGSSSGSSSTTVKSAPLTVTATGGGYSISASASAFLSSSLQFSGTVSTHDAGDTVEIQRSGHETDWQWSNTVSAVVAKDGTFSATWKTNHIGQFALRAEINTAGAARAASASPTVTVIVYRPSIASWYAGKSEWGAHTACHVKLTRTTLGVANRTLPCGTPVAFYYKGRTLTVPVIDRGPYANHADWDLTQYAAKLLGMQSAGVVTLGAVSLPSKP
jgi:rare lipoprotein A